VILHDDASVEVRDNGRGIPVDVEPKTGLSGIAALRIDPRFSPSTAITAPKEFRAPRRSYARHGNNHPRNAPAGISGTPFRGLL
ncbi:hypothetical protein AB0D73_29525, partial [Streptomyces sp. NPDC048215]|uniref:hypothetical protein n=1 Tax=Streptomyces sp. NPDC048215 TaxID=3156690 RepID=UPI00340ABD03